MRNKNRLGFTLVETLISLAVGLIVLAAVITFAGVFRKASNAATVKASLTRQADATSRFLMEDVSNAGVGTFYVAPTGATALVRDAEKQLRPAAWIADEGRTLICLRTSAAGAGRVESIQGKSSPPRILIRGVDQHDWKSITNGRMVVVVNQTGPPTLCRLVTSPQPAQVSDLEDRSLAGRVNLDGCLVAAVEPISGCPLIATANTAITPGALCVPLQSIVRFSYRPGSGLVRDEFDGCSAAVTDEGRAQLVFAHETTCAFAYLTADGVSGTLPADWSQLRGIQVALRMRDRESRMSLDMPLTLEVKEWNR